MKKKDDQKNLFARQTDDEGITRPEGYPLYPSDDDIYSKYHEEKNLDPDTIARAEDSADTEEYILSDESNLNNDLNDKALDLSELELDDFGGNTGDEDEENNYYSLGGDDHQDLEEEQQIE